MKAAAAAQRQEDEEINKMSHESLRQSFDLSIVVGRVRRIICNVVSLDFLLNVKSTAPEGQKVVMVNLEAVSAHDPKDKLSNHQDKDAYRVIRTAGIG